MNYITTIRVCKLIKFIVVAYPPVHTRMLITLL